jgi:hypothetical protein
VQRQLKSSRTHACQRRRGVLHYAAHNQRILGGLHTGGSCLAKGVAGRGGGTRIGRPGRSKLLANAGAARCARRLIRRLPMKSINQSQLRLFTRRRERRLPPNGGRSPYAKSSPPELTFLRPSRPTIRRKSPRVRNEAEHHKLSSPPLPLSHAFWPLALSNCNAMTEVACRNCHPPVASQEFTWGTNEGRRKTCDERQKRLLRRRHRHPPS